MSDLSNSTVEVLFQNKTFNISVDKKQNKKEIYNDFIEKLKRLLEVKDKEKNKIYKLMTINTKEIYLIINENNFKDILNENTKEGKIKLFLDIIEEKDENIIEPLDEDMLGGIKKKNDDGDDFNDEKLNLPSDSNEFKSLKIEDKEKNSQKNKQNYGKEINENNNNNINYDNKKEINCNNSSENLKNEELKMVIAPISKNNNEINKKEEEIKININKENNEIEKDNKISHNNNNINNINLIENNNYNDNNLIEIVEICSFCKKLIKDKIKFECCICDKCILCQKCEKTHDHPCIKFKLGETILSSLNDCHSFISQKHKFSGVLPIKYIKNIFNNTYDIILQLGIDNHIEIRPNKTIEIPVLIKNYSEYPVMSNEFILIVKNFLIVNITYEMKDNINIEPRNYIKINLICTSTDKTGRDNINVEVYSTSIKIRESKFSKFNIEILVSKDEEDEQINKKFTFYPKIQLLNKLRKKMLLYIIDNHFCEKSVTEIYECLCENNWNLDETLNKLNNSF